MMIILLTFLGIIGLILDLKRGRRGLNALLWNNFKYLIVVTFLFYFIISLVLSIYQLETLTGVFTKINTEYGLYGKIILNILFLSPLLTITYISILLMFKEIKYKEKKK